MYDLPSSQDESNIFVEAHFFMLQTMGRTKQCYSIYVGIIRLLNFSFMSKNKL
jgi:hypothetical protein